MRLYFQRRTGKTTCVRLVLKLSSCKLSTRTRIEYRSSEKENFLTSPILKPLKLFIYTYIFHKIYTIVQFIQTVKKSIFFKKTFDHHLISRKSSFNIFFLQDNADTLRSSSAFYEILAALISRPLPLPSTTFSSTLAVTRPSFCREEGGGGH